MERAEPPTGQNHVKKQLHMGAARWRCPRYCSERSAWLDRYVRNLLTPARCAELPLAAREAGQHWPRRRSFPLLNAPLAGSDGAEARHAASGRSGGFAQELWIVLVLRSRALGPTLTAPAGELWPFRARFVRDARLRLSPASPFSFRAREFFLQIVFARIVLLTT